MTDYVELFKRGGNQAIKINPPTGADFHITNRGSDWLWAAFCVFLLMAMVLIGLMFRKPANERIVYCTAIAPVLFMSINYFTMASNLGWIPVHAKYNHVKIDNQPDHPGTRQVFYSRKIGWFMALPWPIVQASLFGNTPKWQIAFNVGVAEIFSVCYLIAGCVYSTYKWGYYSIGAAAIVICSISVMTTTRNLVRNIGRDVFYVFNWFFGIIMFIWLIYPICFGLCEGGNVIQPDSEAVWYGILDIILLGCVPCLFIPLASYLGLERLGLANNGNNFQPLPSEKTMNSIASARNSGETAVSTPKPKPAKKSKKSKK
ncbi:hypothetical protein HG535_0C01750 [Zygotorulaspora mrakii]|uniref:Uncharacterized protein n=1 Tax=Zygotorulaspora mrakii TaxID=42260 RepID=A0A7H9B015_ZYGMR|nr:uncharacterized protein HG535_0C01750 [Zygotorulaspora mrakii]QLG71826.1 hypothetical protein HG535_0C01750 [Zygotorulaspora mrakii]